MSQENVDLAYRTADAFNRRDLDGLLALMDDDVETVPRTTAVEGGGSYHGHDGVRRWWDDLLGVFPDFKIVVEEVHALGDLTLATIRLRGSGAGSAAPTDQALWIMSRLRRGKVIWWRTFDTRAEALEAVGLSEQDAPIDSS